MPQELVTIVVNFADDKSKLYLRVTCTRLYKAVDIRNFTFWFTKANQLPAIVESLSRYQKPISIRFEKTVGLKAVHFNRLSELTNITGIYIKDKVCRNYDCTPMLDLTRLVDLQVLEFNFGSDPHLMTALKNLTRVDATHYEDDMVERILNSNTNLQHITIEAVKNFSQIKNLNHVTALAVRNTPIIDQHEIKTLEQACDLEELQLLRPQDLKDPDGPVRLPYKAMTA